MQYSVLITTTVHLHAGDHDQIEIISPYAPRRPPSSRIISIIIALRLLHLFTPASAITMLPADITQTDWSLRWLR